MIKPNADLIHEVLVAEDEPITRLRLKTGLENMGHVVRVFSNGREAWESFDQNPTRLVISDWQMPGMDGPEFCRRVRARSRSEYTYFILVTAMQTEDEDYQIASDAGTDDFLSKPLAGESLWRRLRVARRILGYTTEIGQLRDLIPMCSHCRQVREDDEYWSSIEEYVQTKTRSRFSHGICPQCYAKVLRDYELERAATRTSPSDEGLL